MRRKRRASRLSLRIRLTLWFLLIIGVSGTLFGGFLYVELRRSLIDSVDLSLRAAIAEAASSVERERDRTRFHDRDEMRFAIGGRDSSEFAVRLLSPEGRFQDGIGAYTTGPDWPPLVEGIVTIGGNAGAWRVMTEPMRSESRAVVGWLQAGESLRFVSATLSRLQEVLFLAIPLMLVVAAAGGIFLVNEALKPIIRMSATARGISATDLSRRIGYSGARDEMSELAETFDRMLDRLQESFEQERRFTADASHELRTPLAVLRGQIDVALSRPRGTEHYRSTLKSMGEEVDRLIRLASDLLYLARLDVDHAHMHPIRVNLSDLVAATAEQFSGLTGARSQRLTMEIEPATHVQGDIDLLIRLLMNLLDNAVKYTPEGGTIGVRVRRDPSVERPDVELAITNSGPGIPSDDLAKVFDRFYRVATDRARATGGSGLGLAIAREIARAHGGSLIVASGPAGAAVGERKAADVSSRQSPEDGGRLTTFTLRLPSLDGGD